VSGLTSAATREKLVEEGLELFNFGFRIPGFGFAQPGMSANAFGSDWAQLEAGTFRFRDPLNQERRFLPLRLDDDSADDTSPLLAEQTRIVAEVERRLSVVEELEAVVSANLQRATRLRQSILPKAFTGEL